MRNIENRMVIDSEWESLYPQKLVCRCCDCETELYEGDKAYQIAGEIYCEECIDNFSIYVEGVM